MPYGEIKGIGKPVARVVMGSMAMNVEKMAYSSEMLDFYFERGGNAFDSAFCYGPNCECALGQWIEQRGLRDKVVLHGKGAHLATWTDAPFDNPGCDPQTLTKELLISLERLRTDYLDIYCMHRDNPKIPVGEFVDVLNEHVKAGRIRVFGGSNWTTERFDEANEYAKKHGKQGFQVLSNNFSLAVWNEPMWAYCFASADEKSKAWLKKTRTPLFAWSSQASGLFTGRFKPEDAGKPEMASVERVWFSPGNFERMKRAEQLAQQKGVLALQIALAYVLCQPFEAYALIGPRTTEETRTSLGALSIRLSPKELAWLNLETDSI
jgi:aryl-alcohol dehydrogenase-like predicted oxidoreductase